MRHAKSDWGDARLDDHARPLNRRGRRAATALGLWLRKEGLIPDEILCSSAARTMETCSRLGLPVPPRILGSLYLAEPEGMLADLRGATGRRVLMLGHNPGIADLAHVLAAAPATHERFLDYPTGATMVADLAIDDWSRAGPGTAMITHFVTPRDLS